MREGQHKQQVGSHKQMPRLRYICIGMKTHLHDVAMIPVQAQSDTWVEHGGKGAIVTCEPSFQHFDGPYLSTEAP